MPTRRELANAIRALSMDAVEQAKSGHPGMPMGMADIAEVLWNDFLNHNPSNPNWVNRDRFVLSNGHGSMLLYSLLHLSGYALSLSDLKAFRQLHSKTAGHPEYGLTPGVETTTGPLGQGLANAVGMAIAEALQAKTFNQKGYPIVDHYTYCFAGDGCLMEGISHEACSLAGTLGLGKLVLFWDDNGISIDGKIAGWCLDDTIARFKSYGWHVIPRVDGHDSNAIKEAIEAAQAVSDKPTLIACRTTIGFGAPHLAGTEKCHGAALGADEVQATREALEWPHQPFEIPESIQKGWDGSQRGQRLEDSWNSLFEAYQKAHPELAKEFLRRTQGQLPASWETISTQHILEVAKAAPKVATRKASQQSLNALATALPELLGGSADLTGSNLTKHDHSQVIVPQEFEGNYLFYGVREFGMSAIMNGVTLHGGFIPYGGTFLTFADYAKNAIRMAALMKQRVIFVYSHDSIGLGEDGPTHQPIEQLAMLRLTPNVFVWRPCDATETAVMWQQAIERQDAPSCLALTRQGVPAQTRTDEQIKAIAKGGYVLLDTATDIDILLIATGSEVTIAMEAATQLSHEGHGVRVVSMPCVEQFLAQDNAYQASVLPPSISKRIAIEAGATAGWYQFVGTQGQVIGIDRFGESAPFAEVYEHLGVTKEAVIEAGLSMLANEAVTL